MPVHKNPFEKGVMIIVFDVVFPKARASASDAELLGKILPKKLEQTEDRDMEEDEDKESKPLKKSNENVVEEVVLKEYGSTERVGKVRKEVYSAGGDDDDDDDDGGGGQVRCAQQ